jgi:hypothetical protein
VLLCEKDTLELGMTENEEHVLGLSIICLEIYATIHSIMYVPKMLLMLGIFLYIWYWGGFEKQDDGKTTHLEALEKIIEM